VDNCPLYDLPNTFTPNDDGKNDFFTPFPNYRFIAKVDFQLFNRWGNKVFSTTDAAIKWDGKNESGVDLAEGVYYYVCKVFEKRVEGIVEQQEVRKGYIELIRGK
jgi:gliding motility-associated-like protein